MSTADRLSKLRAKIPFPLAAPTWPGGVHRDPPERHVGLDYDHDWSRRYPVRLLRAMVLDNVTRPLARVVAPTTFVGAEHLRRLEAPVIFAANHTSHLDTPLLLTSLPTHLRHRTVVAAASDYFFDRTWKATLWAFALAAVPIDRSKVNRQSADVAASLLEDGWSLVIFPEGGRSPDGWMQPFRGGAAYLSRRTGRPVVPVYLRGTRHVLPKSTSSEHDNSTAKPKRTPVTIAFGPPMTCREGEDARRFSERIEGAVTLLADELVSDWWEARRRHHQDPEPLLAGRGPEAAPWRRSWALDQPPRREDARWPAR